MIKRQDKYLCAWKPELEASPMAFLASRNLPLGKAALR